MTASAPDEPGRHGPRRLRTRGAAETESAAAGLAVGLRPGDVVLISGELGSGKTTFVRGACRALGVTERVTSPTFTLGQLYAGEPVEVAHLDLYRLEGLEHEDPALLADYLTPQRIGFVEWPAVGEAALSGLSVRVAARVRLAHLSEHERELEIA